MRARASTGPTAAPARPGQLRRLGLGSAVVALLVGFPAPGVGQAGRPELRVERADGSFSGVRVELDEGYAAVPLDLFGELGWSVGRTQGALSLAVPGEISITLALGSPYFRWDGVVLQLTDPPYDRGATAYVPLQLLTDFFPRRLPDLYDFDGPNATLRAGDPTARGAAPDEPEAAVPESRPPTVAPPVDPAPADDPGDAGAEADRVPPSLEQPSAYDGVRVVVIDPGHGGEDPGAMGPGGIREKAVALGIAAGVARILRDQPMLEVHMTRDSDSFVDLWDRGEIATELKGDRPGIFVSIHANSFPGRRSATGFETYFLSEARTEHERRVAAIENAPLSFPGSDVDAADQPDLDFILRELRNLDHQHWSALLAELVQDELDGFHPGPNRGVKQGVLAVLTNALMPSVLVEVGYLSNDQEGRLLGESEFQASAARAIADAVVRFFERYPPGSGLGGLEQP